MCIRKFSFINILQDLYVDVERNQNNQLKVSSTLQIVILSGLSELLKCCSLFRMTDPVTQSAKRELVGLAKQRILKLRRELQEYVQEIYPQVAATNETIMDDVMVEAVQEVASLYRLTRKEII